MKRVSGFSGKQGWSKDEIMDVEKCRGWSGESKEEGGSGEEKRENNMARLVITPDTTSRG